MARRDRGKDVVRPAASGTRRKRPVYVYTEGRVTEPEYIDAVKGLTAIPVEVHIANRNKSDSDRMPGDLVELAISKLSISRRADRKAGVPKRLWTDVWCLFDHDGRDHNTLVSVLNRAERNGVRVAFSHPCFELWRLLHVKPANGTFGGDCGRVAERLPTSFHQVEGGHKHVIPGQIRGAYQDARKNAEQLNAQYPSGLPRPSRDPYTDVHLFVEEGLGVSAY